MGRPAERERQTLIRWRWRQAYVFGAVAGEVHARAKGVPVHVVAVQRVAALLETKTLGKRRTERVCVRDRP